MASMFTESAIHQKTPQQLTALLYEACLNNLEGSIEDIQNKDYVIANYKIQKANDILHRLGAGINYEAGIIAEQLDMLYNYMADRLVEANLNKDTEIIKEVIRSLEEISSAWNQALKNKAANPAAIIRQRASAYEKNVFTEEN